MPVWSVRSTRMSKLAKVDRESAETSLQNVHVFDASFTTKRHTELKHRTGSDETGPSCLSESLL